MAYPAKTWAKVKADYETGNFTIDDLHKKYTISVDSLKRRCNGWKKGRLKAKIQEKAELTIIEKFSKIGLPPEKVYSVIKDGLEAEKVSIVGNGEAAMAEITPDWMARDKFATQYFKVTGGYSPEKVDHSGTMKVLRLDPLDEAI